MLNYSIHQENLDKNFDCIVIITSMVILRVSPVTAGNWRVMEFFPMLYYNPVVVVVVWSTQVHPSDCLI